MTDDPLDDLEAAIRDAAIHLAALRATARDERRGEAALLTAREAARRCRTSPDRLYAAIRDGALPYVQFGERDRLLRPADLDAWIASHLRRDSPAPTA